MRTTNLLATTAILAAATSAFAGTVRIQSDIAQGTASGFGFSVLHAPFNASGSGQILYRYQGSFETVYDTVAETLTFTQFDAILFEETNLNPNTLGSQAGTLSLVSGEFTKQPSSNLVSGSLTLRLALDGGGEGDVTFLFKPIAYNPLANRWDPETMSLALWGATADMFGEGPESEIGNTGLTSMGMDLLSDNSMQIVPLPSGVALGSAGLLGVFGVRRRRHGA